MNKQDDAKAALERAEAVLKEIAAELEEANGLIRELASDLEAEIGSSYPPASRKYPSEQRRFKRDMDVVYRAKSFLRRQDGAA